MGEQYLDAVRLGRNQWWRYLLGILIILVVWLIIGSVLYVVAVSFGVLVDLFSTEAGPATNAVSPETFLESAPPLATFTGTFLTFVPLLVGVLLVVRFIHGRPILTLITPRRRVDWRRLMQGFLVFGVLLVLITAIEVVLHPGRYQVSLNIQRFLPFLVVGLVLIPIQTASEEVLFRGYFMQGLSLLIRSPLVLMFLSGLVFTLPHLANPELAAGPWLVVPQYFIVGFALAAITLRDNGLELALGVHAVNNLFAGLIVTFPESAIQGETVLISATLDPVYSLIMVVLAYALFYGLMFGLPSRRQRPATH